MIRRETLIKIVPAIIALTGFLLFYIVEMYNFERIKNQIYKEYKVVWIEDGLDSRIIDILEPWPNSSTNNNPHEAYFILEDSIKRRLHASDELLSNISLDSLFGIGDYISKRPNDIKFKIYKLTNKDTLEFVFELRDDLGYPIRSDQ